MDKEAETDTGQTYQADPHLLATGQNGNVEKVVIDLNPTRFLWQQQVGETTKAFECFSIWLKANQYGEISVAACAKKHGKTPQYFNQLAKNHNWRLRLKAWKNHALALEERERRNAAREQAREWARRRIDVRETGFNVGVQMLERARALLALPVAQKQIVKAAVDPVTNEPILDSQGNPVAQSIVYEFQQHPRDARLFAETGIRLARLSADMSTENLALVPEDVNFDAMSDAELEEYASRLSEIRKTTISNGAIDGNYLTPGEPNKE